VHGQAGGAGRRGCGGARGRAESAARPRGVAARRARRRGGLPRQERAERRQRRHLQRDRGHGERQRLLRARRPSQSFFSTVFGVGTPTPNAAATATVRSARGCGAHSCPVVPWGVPDSAQSVDGTLDCSQPLASSLGQTVTLKSSTGTSGNDFALRLPNWTGSSCDTTTNGGASLYRDQITGPYSSQGATTCGLWSVDAGTNTCTPPSGATCFVDTLTGNSVGPTIQGLTNRICTTQSSCTADTLQTVVGNCDVTTTRCPLLADSPRLLIAPIRPQPRRQRRLRQRPRERRDRRLRLLLRHDPRKPAHRPGRDRHLPLRRRAAVGSTSAPTTAVSPAFSSPARPAAGPAQARTSGSPSRGTACRGQTEMNVCAQ
jgi:hypothetical protein